MGPSENMWRQFDRNADFGRRSSDTLSIGVIVVTIHKAVVQAADVGGKSGKSSTVLDLPTFH